MDRLAPVGVFRFGSDTFGGGDRAEIGRLRADVSVRDADLRRYRSTESLLAEVVLCRHTKLIEEPAFSVGPYTQDLAIVNEAREKLKHAGEPRNDKRSGSWVLPRRERTASTRAVDGNPAAAKAFHSRVSPA